jgi:hypothetical protein
MQEWCKSNVWETANQLVFAMCDVSHSYAQRYAAVTRYCASDILVNIKYSDIQKHVSPDSSFHNNRFPLVASRFMK